MNTMINKFNQEDITFHIPTQWLYVRNKKKCIACGEQLFVCLVGCHFEYMPLQITSR